MWHMITLLLGLFFLFFGIGIMPPVILLLSWWGIFVVQVPLVIFGIFLAVVGRRRIRWANDAVRNFLREENETYYGPLGINFKRNPLSPHTLTIEVLQQVQPPQLPVPICQPPNIAHPVVFVSQPQPVYLHPQPTQQLPTEQL